MSEPYVTSQGFKYFNVTNQGRIYRLSAAWRGDHINTISGWANFFPASMLVTFLIMASHNICLKLDSSSLSVITKKKVSLLDASIEERESCQII